MKTSLTGLTVINTRPAHQAKALSESLTAAGATVIEFPLIAITPVSDLDRLQGQLSHLNEANIAIFTSANAVEFGLQALGGAKNWPNNVVTAAVGPATAAKISSQALPVGLVAPAPYNSEALLTLPELQDVRGKKVVLLRGEGGREKLADTLRQRGAEVNYIECYHRSLPDSRPADLYQCWDQKRVLCIVITSNEALQNLFKLIDEIHVSDLLDSTLVVISQRAVNKASELGFKVVPELTPDASNTAIVETIRHWFKNRDEMQN